VGPRFSVGPFLELNPGVKLIANHSADRSIPVHEKLCEISESHCGEYEVYRRFRDVWYV
jgi:hypothetical protein